MRTEKHLGDMATAGMVFALWMFIGLGIGIEVAILRGAEKLTLVTGSFGGVVGAGMGGLAVFGSSRLARGLWIGGVVGVLVVWSCHMAWRLFGA